MELEPHETLDSLAKLNIPAIELSGFYNWSPREMHNELSDRKLKVYAIHGPVIKPQQSAQTYIDWALPKLDLFSTTNLCFEISPRPFDLGATHAAVATYDALLTTLVAVAEYFQNHGIRISYHCYDHDFLLYEGKRLITRLLDRVLPRNLGLQLDTYWLWHSNVAPETIESWPVHSIHLNKRKDDGQSCVIGTDHNHCEDYIKVVAKSPNAIDYILENDPADSIAQGQGNNAFATIEQCVKRWPETWRNLSFTDESATPS